MYRILRRFIADVFTDPCNERNIDLSRLAYTKEIRSQTSGTAQKNKGTEEVIVDRRILFFKMVKK